MPLKRGSSQATISANTEEMIRAGYRPDVASAAAHRKANEKPEQRHTNNVTHGAIHLHKQARHRT